MNNEQYKEFLAAAKHLFALKRIDVDGRFLQAFDVQDFYKRFCSGIDCRIVSLSTTPKYFEILAQELKNSSSLGLMNGDADSSLWIGSDILGWDIDGFHSFLCNSLQTGLPGAAFHKMGLLANDFCDVIRYAEQIKGLGEPVEWIPCRLGVPSVSEKGTARWGGSMAIDFARDTLSLGRRQLGYGRVLPDYHKLRKGIEPFWDILKAGTKHQKHPDPENGDLRIRVFLI